ncbi:MAG: farnesyl-diphosphate farnesyltransferase [Phycisphaerales bacterium]|nr:farnesyl-diphosphate farnesyltransferase [Phycisphaerales bacterium]
MTAASSGISLLAADDDSALLRASAERCGVITRVAARNFYHGLKLLPEPKRSQMYALYAYMRLLDDIADEDDGRSRARRVEDLAAWRELTGEVFAGRLPDAVGGDPGIWPAVADLVRRRAVPRHLFDAAIAGQQQDLDAPAFDTFDELHEYCYRVAGVVGVASVYVWGFNGGADTIDLAVKRGVAFQLTNILRDLRADAALGRTYLPRAELAAAGVTPEQIAEGRADDRFVEMVRSQVARAESYYAASAALEGRIDADSRPTLAAMTEIYHGLLKKIARDPARVLRERVSLSVFNKLWIAARAKRAERAVRVRG